jgi:hypothetical protein
MNLLEATERLNENRGDRDALREFYNHFDPFIISLIKKEYPANPDFDLESAEQELRQTLLEIVDRYQPGYSEESWKKYIFESLRHRLNDLLKRHTFEKQLMPVRLESPVHGDEESQTWADKLVAVEQDVYSILESAEAESIIDMVQDELRNNESSESQLAWKVLSLILEAAPEELTHAELLREMKKIYPDQKWYMTKLYGVLDYLKDTLQSHGFSDELAVA